MSNQPKKAPELLPCPHCGKAPELYQERNSIVAAHWVECLNCEAQGGADCDPESAAKHWNRRATLQPGNRCYWLREPEEMDGNDWISDCGANFSFIDEGPVQNGFQYCPKCGRELRQLRASPEGDQ